MRKLRKPNLPVLSPNTAKFSIIVFMLFALISLVSAAPPFESGDGGMEFAPSTLSVFKADTTFKAHVHVINATAIQTNVTTSCLIHLYDSFGNHTLEANMGYDSNGLEFTYLIPAATATVGQHSYILYCNNTNLENHLIKGSYLVTSTGNELTLPRTLMHLGLFSLLIFLFAASLGVIPLIPAGDNRDDDKLVSVNSLKHLRKVMYAIAWLLLVVIVFFASNISYAYLDGELFGLMFFRIFLVMLSLSLPMVVIWFIWILVSILQDKKTEKLLYRGFESY